MQTPLLSIISPYNGSNILKYFLQSLQQQSLDPSLFEVIIVEDGDKDGKQITKLFRTKFSLRLIPFERKPEFVGHSAGLCRNLGARFAAGEYFVFIDTDCVLHPDCLKQHLNILQKEKYSAVCGYACELPASNRGLLQEGFYESYQALEELTRIDDRLGTNPKDSVNWDYWYTCNAAVHRDIFFKSGGFDESGFRCHDMDLAYRLAKAGCRFNYLPEARIIHIEHPRSLKSRAEQREGWKLLAYKHSELEEYVFNKLLESERYQLEVAEHCESRFLQITDTLPGFREGFSWIVSADIPIEAVLENIGPVPFNLIQQKESLRLQLGLHRNCWDYEIFIPQIQDDPVPQISVLIPFFNSSRKISKAVTSVLLQTIQNFEIILIDDKSDDDTVSYLLPFIRDSRIRLLSSLENQGLSNSLNVGVIHSGASIILHLDSDDWLEPEALEEICRVFDENPQVGAVYADAFLHINGQVIAERGYQIDSFEEFFNYNSVQAPRAYRKEFIQAIGGWSTADAYSGRFYEDRLMLATLSRNYEVKWIDRLLYNCFCFPESLSRINASLTASAKLAILYDQANKYNRDLTYKHSGRVLKADLKPRKTFKNHFRWSIIIPFHKGADLLRFSIKSWLESDFMENEGEIIIVDDASGEDLQSIIELSPQKIKVINHLISYGPAQSRNDGVSAAKYEMIFFSDADHIVPNDVLSKHAKRHLETSEDAAVVGCIFGRRTFTSVSSRIQKKQKEKLLNILRFSEMFNYVADSFANEVDFQLIDQNSSSAIWKDAQKFSTTDYWLADWGKIILKFGDNLEQFQHRWTRLSTGSVSMQKKVFEKLGGFNHILKSMEDWEIGIRLQKMGGQIIIAPEAEPFHQVHPIDEYRNVSNELAAAYLSSTYPELIKNLVNDNSEFVPPAKFSFLPKTQFQTTYKASNSFEKFENQQPDISDDCCLITFDDGPHPLGTRMILGKLAEFDARAVFFLLGNQVKRYADVVKEIVDAGHDIGIHSWTHTDSGNFTTAEMTKMLSLTKNLIFDITGKTSHYSRPPYGKLSPSYSASCRKLGLTPIGWDTSADDWGANSEKDIIIKLACQGIKNKILLFHDGTGSPENTTKAVAWLLNVCRSGNIRTVLPNEFIIANELTQLHVNNPFI